MILVEMESWCTVSLLTASGEIKEDEKRKTLEGSSILICEKCRTQYLCGCLYGEKITKYVVGPELTEEEKIDINNIDFFF